MKNIVKLIFMALLIVTISTTPTSAARSTDRGAAKPPSGETTSTVGYDVSYPQCGKTLPSNAAFAIIGVNGGDAASTNPCLASQLSWGDQSTGSTNQSKLQLYVNTANPGEVIDLVSTWPKNNLDINGIAPVNKYGNTCNGGNDLACSWLYGWNRALDANQNRFAPEAIRAGVSDMASDYFWWLDVETMNTWQSGSAEALKRNVATLEGMVSYFNSRGIVKEKIGLYSTAYQWGEITGNYIDPFSNLNALANWRPSGTSLKNAKNNCRVAPLTAGGYISLTQYIVRNLDNNHSCV